MFFEWRKKFLQNGAELFGNMMLWLASFITTGRFLAREWAPETATPAAAARNVFLRSGGRAKNLPP